jgi:hypothetical protein
VSTGEGSTRSRPPGWSGYNPNFLGLLPEHLRQPLLAALTRRGIVPFTERDWQELAALRELFAQLEEMRSVQPSFG